MYNTAIVDGNNIFFKSFSTQKLSIIIDGDETNTGATFGFIQSLLTLKRNYLSDDSNIIVAWDMGYRRRTEMYPEYKANRNKDEWDEYENFKAQKVMLMNTLSILGVPQAYKEGEEADDIVGTLSKIRRDRGEKVIIMSADKDFQQLIDSDIDLLAHKGRDNIKVWTDISWEEVNGFHPKYFSYILGLMGDKGDNIPGVQGIGEKGAYKLIIENFDLIDSIIKGLQYNHLIPEKQNAAMKKLLANVDDFILSYKLAKIDRNLRGVKIKKGLKDMERLEEIFEMYKFNQFLKKSNWESLEAMQ